MGNLRIYLLLFVFFSLWQIKQLSAQILPDPKPLQAYIQQALDSNLVLRQKMIGLSKSMIALQDAKSYFLPSVQLLGNYTLAQGGRQIIVPVGDLLNPVYSTLNALTSSNVFPQIENASEQFLPNNFYDIRVRTTYPLLNPDLKYNRTIKEQQITLSEGDISIYKRALTKDVKTAYFNYLMAIEAMRIYESTKEVVARGLRVNQSLLNNGKGLPAYISRSEAEVQQVQSQWENAKNDAEKAKAYFNFLLNRPLTDSIEPTTVNIPNALPIDAGISIDKREELEQLETVASINQTVIHMNELYKKPRLSSFIDLGAQAFDFAFDRNAPYYLMGLQLDLPIFQGKRNLYKIDQSKKDLEQTRLKQQSVSREIELATFAARNDVLTAFNNYKASQKQVQAAQSYFKLIDRGRTEGINSFIEWLDARNQLTTAEIQEQINRFKTLITLNAYERETGLDIIFTK